MMSQGANALTEYSLRVFSETWLQLVLRQLVKLEAAYETDPVVIAVAAGKAKLFQKYGISQVTDDLLTHELTLTVNVGQGATDPDSRLQRLTHAFMLDAQMVSQGPKDMDVQAFRQEIFGLSGFPGGAVKYFKPGVDPQVQQAMQIAQQAEQKAQETIDKAKFQLLERERQLDNREHQLEMEVLEKQRELGADTQKAIADTNIAIGESIAKQRNDAAEADNKMKIEREKAANAARIKREEAILQAGIERWLAQQKADNERLIAVAKAKKVSTIEKKGAGKWQKTEETVQ